MASSGIRIVDIMFENLFSPRHFFRFKDDTSHSSNQSLKILEYGWDSQICHQPIEENVNFLFT